MNSDFKDILLCLNQHKVRYLIVGGYAVMKYAEPRYTKDIDIWVEPSLNNSKKVYKALDDYGAPVDNLAAEDFAKAGVIYIMGVPPVRVDIITRISGVTFATAWKNKTFSKLYNEKVPFIGLNELIRSKKAAGRPQDLLDLDNLMMVKRTKK
ncbi:MAG: DUF6036 family nucleotidyltransferase [Bdellovibrionota bacterium]